MTQQIKYLLCKFQSLSFGLQNAHRDDADCNTIAPMAILRISHGPASLGEAVTNNRDPVLNEVEKEDKHSRLSSNLH